MGGLANTKEGGATLCTINPSCAENANDVSKMLLRNASSLSTQSSDFEFDVNDETPLSPKPLCSPVTNYTANHFPNGESVLTASTTQYCAEKEYPPNHFPDGGSAFMAPTNYESSTDRDDTHKGITPSTIAANLAQIGLPLPSSRASSKGENGKVQIKRPSKQGSRGECDQISEDHLSDNDNYGTSASELRVNQNVNGGRRGTNYRSLLNRRNLEQLLPLANYNNYQKKKEAVSASSSPLSYHANHFSNFFKFEESWPDHAWAASPDTDSKSSQKKSRKWAFNLDFLKKFSSPRVYPARHHGASYDNHADYLLNHVIKPNQHDHCGSNAADDEVESGNYSHEGGEDTAAAREREARDKVKQRIDHYRAAAAASEAWFNHMISQSINVNYGAAADHATKERRFNEQINQSAAEAGITKYESPRQSTSSVISSASSSPRRADNEMIRANHRMSPRLAGQEYAFTRGRAPMSPHAVHYEQQKARADELRRKTYLPYRESLLGACFFPLSTHAHQAVH